MQTFYIRTQKDLVTLENISMEGGDIPILKCNLDFSQFVGKNILIHATWVKGKILFTNLKDVNIKIVGANIDNLLFKNCNINNLYFETVSILKDLDFKNVSIKRLVFEDFSVKNNIYKSDLVVNKLKIDEFSTMKVQYFCKEIKK